MPLGDTLKRLLTQQIPGYLEQGSKGIQSLTSSLTGGEGMPTGADMLLAESPDIEARGIAGILGRLGQVGAKRRVASDKMGESMAARERRARKEEAEIGQIGAQTEATKALVPTREAQASYTEARRDALSKDRELKRELELGRQNIARARNTNDLEIARSNINTKIQEAEASLKRAQASIMQAESAQERVAGEIEYRQRLLDLQEARDAVNAEVARKRAEIYGQQTEYYGRQVGQADQDITTTEEVPGLRVGTGTQAVDVPATDEGFFKLIQPGQPLFEQMGGRKGFFGIGAKPVPVTPTIIKKERVQEKRKTGAAKQLTSELAKQYLQKAKGNKDEARKLAKADGYTF